jgi:uncharacterized protein
MRLEFAGTVTVAAPQQRVWDHLMDAEFVATCAPGVAGVETVSDTEYRAVAKVGVGSLSFKFTMAVELTELDPPTRSAMRVQGKAPGSVLDATSTVVLSAAGAKATELAWTASADARGSIAGTGARLLKGTAGKLIEKFWATFAKRVEKATR